jgi:hypothetical protein
LELANKFKIPQLKDLCQKYLINNLNENTVCSFYNEAFKQKLFDQAFLDKLNLFVIDNCTSVLESSDFLNLEKKPLITLLSDDNIPFNEDDLFVCITKWLSNYEKICSNDKEYKKAEEEVISQIRFGLMEENTLNELVKPTKLCPLGKKIFLLKMFLKFL